MSNASPSASGKPGRKQLIIIVLLLIFGAALGTLILRSGSAKPAGDSHGHEEGAKSDKDDGHGHAEEAGAHAEEATPKGPNGGQLFTEGDFSLELLLVEEGGEPRFKAWLSDKTQPMPLTGTEVAVTLTRPNGDEQEITLRLGVFVRFFAHVNSLGSRL